MFKDSGKVWLLYRDLNPYEVKEILDKRNGTRLIDVREEWEHRIARIENSELMPISNFTNHIEKLNKDDELVIYATQV
jgi:rhodanese-related sulfurtransferase